jgi:hypothetical protein
MNRRPQTRLGKSAPKTFRNGDDQLKSCGDDGLSVLPECTRSIEFLVPRVLADSASDGAERLANLLDFFLREIGAFEQFSITRITVIRTLALWR